MKKNACIVHVGLVALFSFSLLGCDRMKDVMQDLACRFKAAGFKSSGKKNAGLSDQERILRKFGPPLERLGIGKATHSEHGISYNRKWNYYYNMRTGKQLPMRTVYFVDDRFVGSVIRQPNGTVRKETMHFAY